MTNKNEEHVIHSLIYVGQKKTKKTIIYSKMYVRTGFQLIFIFHRYADKYSVTLCS